LDQFLIGIFGCFLDHVDCGLGFGTESFLRPSAKA
jgi:hypothetical protein